MKIDLFIELNFEILHLCEWAKSIVEYRKALHILDTLSQVTRAIHIVGLICVSSSDVNIIIITLIVFKMVNTESIAEREKSVIIGLVTT